MPSNDNIPKDSSGWDGVASDYSHHVTRFTSLHATDLLCSVQPHIHSAQTILDIASGPGAAPLAYLSLFPNGFPSQTFIATDFSPSMVALAEAQVNQRISPKCQTRFQFQVENGLLLEGIDDHSVDLVVSVFGVFLISPNDHVFAQIRRVLKPGGIFANAAWTGLPSVADQQLADSGFSKQFQQTVQQVVSSIVPPQQENDTEPPPWKAWTDPKVIRTLLQQHRFSDIVIHRTIHSTTFRNVATFWDLISKTCPFADLSKTTPEKLAQVKDALKQAFTVGDDDVLFMIMSSNLSVCSTQTDSH